MENMRRTMVGLRRQKVFGRQLFLAEPITKGTYEVGIQNSEARCDRLDGWES